MKNELDRQCRIISLEATVPGSEYSIMKKLSNLSKAFSEVLGVFGRDARDGHLPVIERLKLPSNYKEVRNIRYTGLQHLPASLPIGLSVTGDEYFTLLKQYHAGVSGIATDVVGPFNRWVEERLGHPDLLKNVTVPEYLNKHQLEDLDKLAVKLGKCFGEKSTKTYTFGDVAPSVKAFETMVSEVDAIVISLEKFDRAGLLKQVDQLSANLALLASRIKEKPEAYPTSARTGKTMADMTQTVARYLEHYSVFHVKMKEFSVSLQLTLEALEKVK